MIEIKTIEQWEEMLPLLRASSRRLWRWQFGADEPEGLHVWLYAPGLEALHIVTHKSEVGRVILEYRP